MRAELHPFRIALLVTLCEPTDLRSRITGQARLSCLRRGSRAKALREKGFTTGRQGT